MSWKKLTFVVTKRKDKGVKIRVKNNCRKIWIFDFYFLPSHQVKSINIKEIWKQRTQ